MAPPPPPGQPPPRPTAGCRWVSARWRPVTGRRRRLRSDALRPRRRRRRAAAGRWQGGGRLVVGGDPPSMAPPPRPGRPPPRPTEGCRWVSARWRPASGRGRRLRSAASRSRRRRRWAATRRRPRPAMRRPQAPSRGLRGVVRRAGAAAVGGLFLRKSFVLSLYLQEEDVCSFLFFYVSQSKRLGDIDPAAPSYVFCSLSVSKRRMSAFSFILCLPKQARSLATAPARTPR